MRKNHLVTKRNRRPAVGTRFQQTKWRNQRDRRMARPPVIVEHLGEHARMAIEEVLVEDGIVVGQGLR